MAPNSPIYRFEYDGWKVSVELDGSWKGFATGHADLEWKGNHQYRIALTGEHKDGASAISSLSDKSRVFIDDWRGQRFNGDSTFVAF